MDAKVAVVLGGLAFAMPGIAWASIVTLPAWSSCAVHTVAALSSAKTRIARPSPRTSSTASGLAPTESSARQAASTAAANTGVGWIGDRRHAENVPALAAAVGSTAAVGRAGFADTGGSDVDIGAVSAHAAAVKRMMARAASHRSSAGDRHVPQYRPDAAGVQRPIMACSGRPSMRALVALAGIAVLAAACGASPPPTSSPSAPPAVVSPNPEPSSSAAVTYTVKLPAKGGHKMRVVVHDPGGVLAGPGSPRRAEAADVANTPRSGDAALAEGRTGKMLVASWVGTSCDKKVDVTVVGTQVLIAPAPRTACDSQALGRAVTLKFKAPVKADDHARDVHPAAEPIALEGREPQVRSRPRHGGRRSRPGRGPAGRRRRGRCPRPRPAAPSGRRPASH